MILADLGADVIRIERPGGQALGGGPHDLLTRGRPSVALDLKRPEAVRTVLDLAGRADVLVEGLRPGVAERLGFGPDACRAVNQRLVYGRMTGWGQDGPLAATAGHDINYISVAGALFGLGQDPVRPQFPANLLGDFGGGSTYLVIGLLAALLEARLSGQGQVVDAAIVDGTAHLSAMHWGQLAAGAFTEDRAANLLDGGVPFYDVYETADGRHLSVGALEPRFFQTLVRLLDIESECPDQDDVDRHPEMRTLFAQRISSRTMAEWVAVFEGTDACVAPVLRPREAARHPHMVARGTLVERGGRIEPGPAPRFSRTVAKLGAQPTDVGAGTRMALESWGIDYVDELLACGAAVQT
ncbi:CaiB/BaiF CoA transferase family protein [Dactylosporangium roseum]|nr:CaiB/BaiF CoA-transferase family protein [Dactylosporangium roseum]